MTRLLFAANWKMHLGPDSARQFLRNFLQRYHGQNDRDVWFFPAAVSLSTVAEAVRDRSSMLAGAQNVHWEEQGAFTGELSVSMAREAGGHAALVGHSERRHLFRESIDETARKVRALLEADMTPLLCVGERLEEREADRTLDVVHRQLGALAGLDAELLRRIVIAYEPVWAIGTGKTATPDDAADVHSTIRTWFTERGVAARDVRILYGGSVKPGNASALLSEAEIDGVLVGGASLAPDSWVAIVNAGAD